MPELTNQEIERGIVSHPYAALCVIDNTHDAHASVGYCLMLKQQPINLGKPFGMQGQRSKGGQIAQESYYSDKGLDYGERNHSW